MDFDGLIGNFPDLTMTGLEQGAIYDRARGPGGAVWAGFNDVRGLKLFNGVMQRLRIAVRRVRFEQGGVDDMHRCEHCLAELGSRIARTGAQYNRFNRLIAGQLLSEGHGLPRRAVQLAALLFGDDEDHFSRLIRLPSLRLSVCESGPWRLRREIRE